MSEKYSGYCMKFSNEELKKSMIEYLVNNLWNKELIRCLTEEGDEIEINSHNKIGTIVFDGEDENLFINFYGIHTSIFAYDMELMFIDENSKARYTSSDVYDNVVYEGKLREMNHEQMLKMFSDIILCFIDVTDISMIQYDVPKNKYKRYNYYEPHMYTINLKNNHITKKVITYENITINY
ncbi:MAG: hypothetical protein K2I03_14410 [Lachnospiraceae bacterium]|nr:hypothetical protein [Lachnospiraceae bacterium]MDE6252632.1 hypothetical protein [Lachnospiraceae bacterium]